MSAPVDTAESGDQSAEALSLPHDEFRTGVPLGRYNLIVDPKRAQRYVKHRLFVVGISLPLLGIGAALGVSGYPWIGLPLVIAGILLPRVVKAHAPKILLYLALHDARTYQEAMEFEILEVRHRPRA